MDDAKKLIDHAAANHVQILSLTGGEPLLFLNDITELVSYAVKAGIRYVRTGTNGFLFRVPESRFFEYRIQRIAEELTKSGLRNLWISIDSCKPDVHEKMRGLPNVIKGIEKALPIFHTHGLYPSANLGINRNLGGGESPRLRELKGKDYYNYFFNEYLDGFDRFYHFVENLGFTSVNACYPMSIDKAEEKMRLKAGYTATSTNRIIRFSRKEKAWLFKALMTVIPGHRSRIRIFTPTCSLYALHRSYDQENMDAGYACRGGVDSIFIDVKNGAAFPCGYRAHDSLGDFTKLNMGNMPQHASCRKCDWECFRDPGNLFGPLLLGFSNPFKLIGKIMKDPVFYRLWLRDLRYFHTCRLFDGRQAPDYKKLSRFGKNLRGSDHQKSGLTRLKPALST